MRTDSPRSRVVDILRRAKFNRVIAGAKLSDEILIERADLVFLDVHSVDDPEDGLLPEQVISEIRARWATAKIVAFGSLLELAAQATRADGWIDSNATSASQVVEIAVAVAHGGSLPLESAAARHTKDERARWPSLSRRERQILGLLAYGTDNLKLATELAISESSIKGYVSSLLRKFHADNRAELALIARAAGLHRSRGGSYFRRD